jgi:hypothetical protein
LPHSLRECFAEILACSSFLQCSFAVFSHKTPYPPDTPWGFGVFSCCFSPVSFACLATLRVDFLLRCWGVSALTRSVSVAEVTQVNNISVSPIQGTDISVLWLVAWGIRCQSSQAS